MKTLKRDYVQVTPLPDAQTVPALIGGWIEDYNDTHPNSGLKRRLPCEFIAAQTVTAGVSGGNGGKTKRQQLQETIVDLRENRDKLRQQAAALLEDKRNKGFRKNIIKI